MNELMSTKNDPAFPFVCEDIAKTQFAEIGLTKLEWFAGMAIQGTCPGRLVEQSHVDDLAQCAFRMAEAMIAEGEKRSK